jgi:hypothetical protein
MTNIQNALKQLQSQRADLEKNIRRIDLALMALGGLDGKGKGRGRRGERRNLSAAARNRIAAAQRKRWAKWKAEHKS